MYTVVYVGLVPGTNTTSSGSSGSSVTDNALANFAARHSTLASAIGGVAATYVFFWALLHFTRDPKEPPLVSTAVPFLSPILGMVKWSMGFYGHMK